MQWYTSSFRSDAQDKGYSIEDKKNECYSSGLYNWKIMTVILEIMLLDYFLLQSIKALRSSQAMQHDKLLIYKVMDRKRINV